MRRDSVYKVDKITKTKPIFNVCNFFTVTRPINHWKQAMTPKGILELLGASNLEVLGRIW